MRWFQKRTPIVLSALVLAMALTSTLLLCLEPKPTAPHTQVILAANEAYRAPEDSLFDTAPEATPGRWSAIVIQSSGTASGNAATLDREHQRLGLVGVGYHFVVGNGKGAPDGQIEMSFRWKRQLAGAHSSGVNGAWYNQHAVGICLVGDAHQPPTRAQLQQLVWLVRALQEKLGIPADHVIVQFDSPRAAPPSNPTANSPGSTRTPTPNPNPTAPNPTMPVTATLFPAAAFRQQLFDPR
jgi:hypothetical protein